MTLRIQTYQDAKREGLPAEAAAAPHDKTNASVGSVMLQYPAVLLIKTGESKVNLSHLHQNIPTSLKIMNPVHVLIILTAAILIYPCASWGIGPNYDYYTKVKFEYQYSDYLEYKWPAYIEYAFGDHPFTQPNPILNSFPEHRGLMRITQGFGTKMELQLLYHYSLLGREYRYAVSGQQQDWENSETLYNARLQYKINDNITANITGQQSTATVGILDEGSDKVSDLNGWMADFGFDYDFGGFFKIEPSISLFWNDIEGTKSNAQSYNLKLRQALTNTTATQVKYSFFNTDPVGEEPGLTYHTVTWWVSKWLPTQTAFHLFFRYHVDNQESESSGPGVDISQYLDWATILTFSYRYYKMTNDDLESNFNQVVKRGGFYSNAFSLLLSRTMWNDTVITLKYRYYTCNQDVRMNTYLLGIEQMF